tara:strand:- start:8860 stop:10311 length:1452 start_codon:yes stop_codon:yes gene_type:complete
MIKKDRLIKLIEPHFIKDLVNNDHKIKNVKSNKLLTHNRFDIAFKLLFLEFRKKNFSLAKEIYKDHIRAFSLNKFTEPGNKHKNSLKKFIDNFECTFQDIKKNGFDKNKSILALSRNNSIANGAHRLSSCIYLNKEISAVDINTDDHIYDYKFFYNRNVPKLFLDFAAQKFIEFSSNTYIAFIWPSAKGFDSELKKIIPNIVYRKDIVFSLKGAHNLLSQIYSGEKWLGNVENNFRGVQAKLVECFKNFNSVRVIAFQEDELQNVFLIKEKIRELFKIGKHSIHITDTKEEALRVSKLVFNENSIHFLNHSNPNRFLSFHNKINEFKNFLEENKIDSNHIVLDSGIVLSAYGLRESKDIDFIALDDLNYKKQNGLIDNHDTELIYHKQNKEELIFNPQFYFYFNDLKFISFKQLYNMKLVRAESKDINDIKMMEALLDNNYFKKIAYKYKQQLNYSLIKIKQKIIVVLRFLGLFDFVKKVIKN